MPRPLTPDPDVETDDDPPTYLEQHAASFVIGLLALCDELDVAVYASVMSSRSWGWTCPN